MPDRSLKRFLALSLPAYAVLFAIHLQNSLEALLHGRVTPDLGYGANAATSLQVAQVACLAYLTIVYMRAILGWKRGQVSVYEVIPVIVALTAAAWTLLPANSSDILEYLGFGRLAGVYGLNPYTHTYSEITDRFATFVTWDDPMPYGPAILPVFAIAGRLSQPHVLLGIYSLKLAWAAIHLVNAWLVYRLALWLTDDAALAVFAFACNPLLLVELIGNGHNDAVLLLCGLSAVMAVRHRRGALAMVLAFLGAIVKLAGIFWVFAIVALLVRQRQWRSVAWGAAACAAASLVVVLWPGCLDALTVLNSQWHYSEDSLHTIVINRLVTVGSSVSDAFDYDTVFTADRLTATSLFVAVMLWRFWRIRDLPALIRESGCVFLMLLLGYAVSVGPWYFTWLLPMAVLTDSDRVRRTIFVACGSVIALYAFPFVVVETGRRHELWTAVRLALALGVPIVFGLMYPLWLRVWQAVRPPDTLAMAGVVAERS